jgi:hypothetical protein
VRGPGTGFALFCLAAFGFIVFMIAEGIFKMLAG